MADLGQLMRIAPITGAGMMGQQFAQEQGTAQIEQQRLAELVRGLQQKYQQDADMHPLEQAYKQAQTQNTLALAGHSNAQTDNLTLDNVLKRATQPNAIAATNAENENKVFTQGINRGNQTRDQFINAATMPGATVAAIRADLAAKGINPDHPSLQPMWGQVSAMDPKQLNKFAADMSTQLGQNAANRDPHYLGTMGSAILHKEGTIEHAKIAAGSAERVARMKLDAAAEAKRIKDEAMDIGNAAAAGKVSYEKAATYYTIKASTEADAEKKAQYNELAKLFGAEALKRAPAQPVPEKTGGVTALPSTGLGDAGGAQAPAPAKGKASSGNSFTIVKE